MLRHAINTSTPNGRGSSNNHGYNANDFLEDSSSSFENGDNDNDDDDDDDDDVTLRAPLPNFHMLLLHQEGSPAETTTTTATTTSTTAIMDYTTCYRQEVLLKNHDDCIRPFISALLVSCRVLRLSMETTFTAACLLHRFANAHSSLKNHTPTQLHHHHHDNKNDDDTSNNHHQNDKHDKNNDNDDNDDWRWIIASCIFLACKVEEEPRRLRDLINMAHMITFHNNNNNYNNNDALLQDNVTPSKLNKKQQQQVNHQASCLSNEQQRQNNATTSTTTTVGGASVAALLYWESEPPDLDSRYWQAKETLVKAEQNVLRWLAFDVTVSHPHRAVVVLLLSQQQQQDLPENTRMSSATTSQRNGSNKPEVVNIQQQQQRPVSWLPPDAATGTLMMQVNHDKGHDTQEQKEQQQHHHDLARLAWTILNNTVFYVEALRHDVISLATAALEMAQEQQQQSPQFAVPVHESVQQHESASTTGTAAAAAADNDDDDDNDDTTAKQKKDICNKETDVFTARQFKKQKSEKTIVENDTNAATVASARHGLQEALARVQRLSENVEHYIYD